MRIDGWESRLNDLVDEMKSQSFSLGDSDCLRLSCRAIQAVTGKDHWPKFCGYHNKREAAFAMAKYGRRIDDVIGSILADPIDIRFAQRGDICCFEAENVDRALGVCVGENSVFLAPSGITLVPTLSCNGAWRVE